MENFNYFVLTFGEALSVLYDVENPIITRFNGSKWNPANVVDSDKLKTILNEAFNIDFTNALDKSLLGTPFVEWDSTASEWKFVAPFEDFFKYLFKEYGNSFCVYSESDEDADMIKGSCAFMDNILNMFVVTFPKYKELYSALETEKNNLLRGVSATTTNKGYNKFKDTPQGAVTMTELDSDNMNTNVTIQENQNTYSDERDTPVARIKEIQERYVSLYDEWAHEFKAFFWEV